MCLICTELAKGKLTSKEAFKNMDEIIDSITGEHFYEVLGLITDKRKEEESRDRKDSGSNDWEG